MKSTRNLLLSAAISALFYTPFAANAGPIAQPVATSFLFNNTGGGTEGAYAVDLIDETAGNALAQGALTNINAGKVDPVTGTPLPPLYTAVTGTHFTLYYQANLAQLTSNGMYAYSNGAPFNVNGATPKTFFTITSGFGEVVSNSTLPIATNGFNLNSSFVLDPSGKTNFFNIYANTTGIGNNLSGTGFVRGAPIYTGRVVDESGSSFNVKVDPATGQPQIGALDKYQTNDYPNTNSVAGEGASDIVIQTVSFNPGYFPDLTAGALIYSGFNTSTVTPFGGVDPSKCFANANGDCQVNYVTGPVNGISGPDFLLQADANQGLGAPTIVPVPEPATTALLGLGLAIFGFLGASRKKQA